MGGSDCVGESTTSPAWVSTLTTNTAPVAYDSSYSLVESAEIQMWFYGYDADGDHLNYTITSLPDHGTLFVLNGDENGQTEITSVPFDCWTVYDRYSVVWYPATSVDTSTNLKFQAFDGQDYSPDATITLSIIAVDDVPAVTAVSTSLDEDSQASITLTASDPDTEFLTIVITELPSHGTLYMSDYATGATGNAIAQYSEWEVVAPLSQYVANVKAVSTFWPSSDAVVEDDGTVTSYPSWHPFQILGEGDAPKVQGDSGLAFCPSSLQGTGDYTQTGFDQYPANSGVLCDKVYCMEFSFNTWASYLADGYTEYIEVEYNTSVYVQSITVGQNRGMGSIVSVKAYDEVEDKWQKIYSGEADVELEAFCALTNQYAYFEPSDLCQPAFSTNLLRFEMDTYTLYDWNELDYARMIGSVELKSGVIRASLDSQSATVVYVPDTDYAGTDTFSFAACDCAYFSSRCSDSEVVTLAVGAVNDAPISSDTTFDLECGTDSSTAALGSFDVDGDTLSYTIESLPTLAKLFDGNAEITTVPTTLTGTAFTLELDAADGDEFPSSFDFLFSATDPNGLTSNSATASVTCALFTCDAGYYYDLATSVCTPCPTGTAEKFSGMRSSCTACPVGSFGPTEALLECVGCDEMKVAYVPGLSRCEACPEGAICPEGKSVVVLPGFWRTDFDSFELHVCPMGETSCPGTESYLEYDDTYTNDKGSYLCADGYVGVKCDSCEDDYFFSDILSQCTQCSDTARQVVIGVGLAFGVFAAMSGSFLCFSKSLQTIIVKLDPHGTQRHLLPKIWDPAKFRIIWAALQITTSVDWALEMSFPQPFRSLKAVLAMPTQLSIAKVLPMGCLFDYTYHSQVLLMTLAPLIFCAVLASIAIADMKMGEGKKVDVCRQGILLVIFLMLPTTSTTIIRTFHCEDLDNGHGRWLFADYSIDCDSASHKGMEVYAILMLLVYPIATPAICFYLLYKHRDGIHPKSADTEFAADTMRKADPKLRALRPMFHPYRPSFWFFEPIDLLRRIIMMGALVTVRGNAVRAAVGFVLALIFGAVYRECTPYLSDSLNNLSTAAMWMVTLVYGTGVVIIGRPFGYDEFSLGVVLVVMLLVLVVFTVVMQASRGSASQELWASLMEREAREIDLSLSHAELLEITKDVGIAQHRLEEKGRSVLELQMNASFSPMNVKYVPNMDSDAPDQALKFKRMMGLAPPPGVAFDSGMYPCWVIAHSRMHDFKRLPVHENALADKLLEELTPRSRTPSPSHTYFISQNWEGALGTGPNGLGKHPDNALNTKLLFLKNLKKHLNVPTEIEIWIWWDGISVPQVDKVQQARAVKSLCYYCQVCTRFMPLVREAEGWKQLHTKAENQLDATAPPGSESAATLPSGELDAYASRGWCRLELIAAFCPKRTLSGRWRRGPIGMRFRYHHDVNDPGIGPKITANDLYDPLHGMFSHEGDRLAIAQLVVMVAKRYEEYAQSGSKAWDETIHMDNRPQWLVEAGRSGTRATFSKKEEGEISPNASKTRGPELAALGGQAWEECGPDAWTNAQPETTSDKVKNFIGIGSSKVAPNDASAAPLVDVVPAESEVGKCTSLNAAESQGIEDAGS